MIIMCAFIWVLEIFGPIFCHVELVVLIILMSILLDLKKKYGYIIDTTLIYA